MDVHIYFHNDDDVCATRRMVEQILAQVGEIMANTKDVQAKVDELTQKVADETTVEESIIELVTGLKAQVGDLRTQLADAIANGADPAALQAVVDGLSSLETTVDTNKQKIADAVTANT